MFSQKEAVFAATTEILKQANVTLNGESITSVMTKDLRNLVVQKLVSMAKNNEIKFRATVSNKKTLESEKLLTAYLGGLVSNHWRRDSRLNGKTK